MSLTVRGILVGLVAIIMQWAPLVCGLVASLCFDTSQLNPLVDAIVFVVQVFFTIVKLGLELASGVMVIWGILRKIYYNRLTHPDAGLE